MKRANDIDKKKRDEIIEVLKIRFGKNMNRHRDIEWEEVRVKLEANNDKLLSLNEMECTGGEPDIICMEKNTQEYVFCDCSSESPVGRRSLCYDRAALDARKENKPVGSAMEIASLMGIELLSEQQYRELQELGEFDRKTSSWVQTPDAIRKLGGALFCDRRYDHVFVYHNGAESYYSARGFRGRLRV
jgi:hypothetical protein